ncbi:N-acetylmuramoyl-L-alanine amidase [Romboutsia sp.]|uniref:N-acetylmuramoyl-L-alanine amidase n=1 Tax=Romboutsia sp. TaxID=1965302 RepID=UPI0039C95B9B
MPDDKYYSLDYRSSKANKQGCDYFVSLHMNSSTNKSTKGCEVWVYDEKSKLYTLSKNLFSNLSNALKLKMKLYLKVLKIHIS